MMMDISWADEFIKNVKPHIFVREEDSLLIRMPNRAHRLNPQGVMILKFLLGGGTAAQLERRLGYDSNKISDVALFLYEVKRCLEGKLKENNHTCAVETKPLELGFSKLPILSEVAVTSRCNLRCAFCYYGCGGGCRGNNGQKREMRSTEINRILEIIYHTAKTPSVSFTGGEPMLRPDLLRLIKRAKKIGLRVNLITNGTIVTPLMAAKLKESGLDSAQVSLEGVTAEVHDRITGVSNSFDRSVAGVKALRDNGITVHTNTTLNLINLHEATRIPRFVREELGLERFSMNLVIPSGSAAHSRAGENSLLIRYSDVGDTVEAIIAQSDANGVEFMWYSPTPLCIFNPITHGLGNKGCSACDGLLSVDCNGDVLPCSSWSEPVGNMLKQDFMEIWESRRARSCRLKSQANPGCRSCDSFAVCHGACPLYWRHFGFEELAEKNGLKETVMTPALGA